MRIEELIKANSLKGKRVAVMGVGSVLRSDDGAGMRFADRLSAKYTSDNLLVIKGSTAPENFTGVIKSFKPEILFIVDAAHMGLKIGDIHILSVNEIEDASFSTHMLPLPVMLNYLKLEVQCDVVLIGIEPENTDLGTEMCSTVADSSDRLADIFYDALT